MASNIPSVQSGEWWYSWNNYICSECGFAIEEKNKTTFRFCPACGAIMDKKETRQLQNKIIEATGETDIKKALLKACEKVINEWDNAGGECDGDSCPL